VLIEGSRHYSNGTRIHLDLNVLNSQKTPYSFFPGQIVAAEGMNVTGRMMIPNRIFFGTPPARMTSSDEEVLRYHLDLQEGLPLQILSACGPYTTTDNMDYAPLMDLVEVIRSLRPDVVILMGPFVPISMGQTELHLEDGTKIQVTHEVFFANKISTLLEELYENENDFQTQFVLVPGVDDAVAEWVFPQAPLTDSFQSGKMLNIPGAEGIEVKTLGLQHVESAGREGAGPRRIHCVSNPCTLRINETIIGITSNDVFFQISADETNGNLESGSRLSRIAQHMLEQQSYCPLFPPPIGINLDLRNIEFCRMPCKPDLLIVPSKLTCFARPVCDSTMVVNPGHLAKGTTGGTYALMEIYPFERELPDSSLEGTIDLPDRITIDIKKI
jgi:DNA polymerase alpha subunit B